MKSENNIGMQQKQKRKPRRRRLQSPFADNLKSLLNERGLSLKSAAEIAQVPVSVIHGWVNGAQANDMLAVARLAKALNCGFQWLLTGEVSPNIAATNLTEVFETQNDPNLSGLFLIEAKRLKKRV